MTIANYFLHIYAERMQKKIRGFSLQAENIMLVYDWPGNVRELANAVEYAVNMEESNYITHRNLPRRIREYNRSLVPLPSGESTQRDLNLKRLEKQAIMMALEEVARSREPKEKAAQLLGISRATLFRKIKEYGLSDRGAQDG